jgi:hypothetical protein
VQSTFISADSTIIGTDGTFISADGTYISVDGTFISADGTFISTDSTVISADGTFSSADSTVISTDGTFISDNTGDKGDSRSADGAWKRSGQTLSLRAGRTSLSLLTAAASRGEMLPKI